MWTLNVLCNLQDKVNLGEQSNTHEAKLVDFVNVVLYILHEDLQGWKGKTPYASRDIQCKRDGLQNHIACLSVELEDWKSKVAKLQDEEEKLIGKFGVLMKALHKDVEVRKMVTKNQDVHKLQLAHKVKYFHMEIDAWKGKLQLWLTTRGI